MAEIMIKLDRKDIEKELNGYQVIVEMWDKSKTFSGKRKIAAEFTEAERNTISSYYSVFYSWYLKKGLPDSFTMRYRTLSLLQRAISLFATL